VSTREQVEFQRCFGSADRMAWVRAQPCVVLGCPGSPCENVHIGMGPKQSLGDSTLIVPACAGHRALLQGALGTAKFAALYHLDLVAEAIDLELRWRQHLARLAEAPVAC
jgi:hypothetical protein